MQQQFNNNVTSIEGLNKKVHAKVQYQNELRRFSVTAGSYHYASLVENVKRLFGFSVDSELQLKYKDDENDMIIVSSDEELKSAIELFLGSNTPLRLTVELILAEKNQWKKGCDFGKNKEFKHKEFRKRCSGRFNSEGQNQPHPCHRKWKGAHLNFKIEKLTQKRNELSEKLKEFGGNAPRLEAKISCIDSRINKMKEFASTLPQQPAVSDCVQRHSASIEGRCARGGRGKWNSSHLNFKIEKLTQKRNKLSEKLKEFGAPAPHLEAKIVRIDTWIKKLKEFASTLPKENPQHSQVSPTAEISDSESSSEGKKWGRRGRCGGNREKWANDPICQQIWALRKEKRLLKRLVSEGPESDLASNVERLVAIQNELAQFVPKKRAEHSQ